MRLAISRWLTSGPAVGAALVVARARRRRRRRPTARGWLGEELPLPLAVRTAQDLAVKAAAEKQYLIFNLLAGGKLAWDGGDFATAAGKWEALLRVQGLDPEIERLIRPAREGSAFARGRQADHGGRRSAAGAARARRRRPRRPPAAPARKRRPRAARRRVSVSGDRLGRRCPGSGRRGRLAETRGRRYAAAHPAHGKVVTQRKKAFIPHVLVVPVGTKVSFRNEDPIFHNVFSLSKPNDFDTGLYKQGATYSRRSSARASSRFCATSTRRCWASSSSSTRRITRRPTARARSRSRACRRATTR